MITVKHFKKHEHSWLPFDCTVKYSTNRRSIQLSIHYNDVVIHCPQRTSIKKIQELVTDHQSWVDKKLTTKKTVPRIELASFDEDVILDRVDIWSKQMGLFPTKVRFSRAKTKWGSCSSQGVIALNSALLKAPLRVIDYIVIHELAHLKHMNHSKSFWELVAQYDPDHKASRKWLKVYGDQLM